MGSNHSPIILTTRVETHKRIMNFRFEEMCLEDPECKEVMKSWSTNDNHHRNNNTLWLKLGLWRRGLMTWSKERLGNNIVQMWRAKQRLQEIGRNRMDVAYRENEILLKK